MDRDGRDSGAENSHSFPEAVSRRGVLRNGVATAGALALGGAAVGAAAAKPGQAGAPGSGGEAVVPVADYADARFEIGRRTEGPETVVFECNEGNDRPILLVGWTFSYVGEDAERTLFTRDNNVDTAPVYEWNSLDRGAKRCDGLVQTPYRRVE
jgi:hypothetical protein